MSASGLNVPRIPSLRTQSPGLGTGCPSWTLVSLSFLVSPESQDALLCTGTPAPFLPRFPSVETCWAFSGGRGWGSQR